MSCLFCQMAEKTLDCDLLYETDTVFAVKDKYPQAPFHALVVPKAHVPTMLMMDPYDQLLNQLMEGVQAIVSQCDALKEGFRLVNNTGDFGGQTIDHIHFHILGARQMTWPPG